MQHTWKMTLKKSASSVKKRVKRGSQQTTASQSSKILPVVPLATEARKGLHLAAATCAVLARGVYIYTHLTMWTNVTSHLDMVIIEASKLRFNKKAGHNKRRRKDTKWRLQS